MEHLTSMSATVIGKSVNPVSLDITSTTYNIKLAVFKNNKKSIVPISNLDL